MEDLLLLIHRIPYPPNKGDKIRSYHLLKHLSQSYRVHLATFVDDEDDWQHVPRVEALCASSHFARLNPKLARVRSLGALLANRSLSLDYYRDAGLAAWSANAMREHDIKRIVVFSSAMAQYAEAFPQARRVVDFCDVDSDKWRQYAEQKSPPMSWLYRHEARQLLAYERHVARSTDAALFVSQPEADLFKTLAPESAAKIGFFNNGVDTDYFSPEREYADPYVTCNLVRCEDSGVPVAFHVHDEIITEVPENWADQIKCWLREAMRTPPLWAPGMPVNTKPKILTRYGK